MMKTNKKKVKVTRLLCLQGAYFKHTLLFFLQNLDKEVFKADKSVQNLEIILMFFF